MSDLRKNLKKFSVSTPSKKIFLSRRRGKKMSDWKKCEKILRPYPLEIISFCALEVDKKMSDFWKNPPSLPPSKTFLPVRVKNLKKSSVPTPLRNFFFHSRKMGKKEWLAKKMKKSSVPTHSKKSLPVQAKGVKMSDFWKKNWKILRP